MCGFRAIALLCLIAPSAAQGYFVRGWNGTSAGDWFGSSNQVASPGDLNGDGFAEVIVGSDQFFGSKIGYAKVFSGLDGSAMYTFSAPVGTQPFGITVAAIGDVSGDGVPDIGVGSKGSAEGFVYSGADGSLIHSFTGSGPYSESMVAAAGDLNGDGIPDVLIGKPCGSGGPTNLVRMFSGADWGLLQQINGNGGCFGSVAGVGDVDGDGLDDVLIGQWLGGTGAGQAFVYSGATTNILFTFSGTAWRDRFGGSVDGPGDVSGDGVPDLLIGATNSDPAGLIDAGQAFLYSGADGSLLFTFSGTAAGDQFGSVAKGTADLNGDGVPDLAIGAPQDSAGPGYVKVYSGADGTVLSTLRGTNLDDLFGTSISNADVNGDGVPDLIIGAPRADPAGLTNAGRVEVHSVVGIPPGSGVFGSGCPGTSGSVPRIQTAWGDPFLGNSSFAVVLSKALGNAMSVLMIGTSNQSWAGMPLPLSLAFIAHPGCSLLVSPDVTVTARSMEAGIVFSSLPIPPVAVLSGSTLYLQWYVVDPGQTPGAMSDGLRLVIR